MSTRCQIGFYEADEINLSKHKALIYSHNDGYPDSKSGVIATILPILQDFHKNRGLNDIEYAAVWLVAKLKTDYLNIGISSELHGDIQYFYAIYPDRIDIYDTPRNEEYDNFKLLKSIPIT